MHALRPGIQLKLTFSVNRYQSRAFLLFPICFNIGVIIGPVLGGLLADPAGSYPSIFGNVKFLQDYPYAPPNLLSAFFLAAACLGVFFGLAEVCIIPSLVKPSV